MFTGNTVVRVHLGCIPGFPSCIRIKTGIRDTVALADYRQPWLTTGMTREGCRVVDEDVRVPDAVNRASGRAHISALRLKRLVKNKVVGVLP